MIILNIWIKRYIGIVTIGGGTLGLASIVDYFYNQLLLAQVVLLILMCSFFLWSAAIGMLILEGNCTRKIWYQALLQGCCHGSVLN